MHLAHGTPVRSRVQPSPVARGTGGFACPRLPEAARLHPRCPSPTRRQARSRPDSTEPPVGQPGPFAYACDVSELSALSRGVPRQSHSRGPSPLRHPSTPEAPFLDGHYPASSVLRASPPPCRPGLPLAGFRLPRARHRQGFPCCYAFHLPCMPTPLPRRKPAGASSLSSQPVGGLPLISEGSASATPVSRPAQRSLSFRPAWSLGHPRRPFSPKCFSPCRYLHEPLWLLPAGATVAGWDSHPPGKRAFPRRTEKSGLSLSAHAQPGGLGMDTPPLRRHFAASRVQRQSR